ncbi:MAG: cob(I)yrinic acid a,c-diamide adenosyltransferase [Bacteroidales bacterium]
MKIYTKVGDKGNTSLLGGQIVRKDSLRIEAYGTIDELNSFIGMLLNFKIDNSDKEIINFVQNRLFDIVSILAADEKNAKYKLPQLRHITNEDISTLEQAIDKNSENLPKLKSFVLPAGSEFISWCNISRTVCRRAERLIVSAKDEIFIPDEIFIFINRLSDYLFVLGRKYAIVYNIDEILWK